MARFTMSGISRRSLWPAASLSLVLGLLLPVAPSWAAGKSVPLSGMGPNSKVQLVTPDALARDGDPVLELLEAREESRRRVAEALGPHGVSSKGLLRAFDRRNGLARTANGAALGDTLKVLLIRIAFDEDRSGSLTSLTTDGNFMLDPDPEIIFDPPPHDRAYFESHLEGLSQYWGSMSGGQLLLETTVLPAGDQDAYRLSDIADYGPCPDGPCEEFWTIDRLVELVQDMVLAADEGSQADGSVSLADFDADDPNTYIIFAHAGGDLQSNLVFTPGVEGYSPNDIPTFFVQLGDDDTVPLTSIDSDNGQPGLITECSVIPESTSQDGLLGSIAAALYHEFGHALGLPDLYSTITGLPTVGYWDIMDNGTNLAAAVQLEVDGDPQFVVGLMPPSTSMWCKWYLGWVDPVMVGGGPERAYQIAPAHGQVRRDKALRLDISPQEFFLVENRVIPPAAPDGWALHRDPDTGVVLFLGSGEPPVNTHFYDFFLPWNGGQLVWRVRQDRIDQLIASNVVQGLPRAQGLELIESDGIQDIGVFEFTTRGFLGSDSDAFRAAGTWNWFGQRYEIDGTRNDLPAEGRPSTESSFRTSTGAQISGIRSLINGPQTMNASLDGLRAAGYPRWLDRGVGSPLRGDPESVIPFQFRGNEAPSSMSILAFASSDSTRSEFHAHGLDGQPVGGTGLLHSFGAGARLAGPPAVARGFGPSGSDALIVALRDGTIHAFNSTLLAGPALAELGGFPYAVGDSLDLPVFAVDNGGQNYVVVSSRAADTIQVLDPGGVVRAGAAEFDLGSNNELRGNVVACDIDGDGAAREIAFVTSSGLHVRDIFGQPIASLGNQFPVRFPSEFGLPNDQAGVDLLAWPVGAGAGGPDALVIVAPEGGVVLLAEQDADGQWSMDFHGRLLSSALVGRPALGDIDGDGSSELVLASEKRIWARNRNGVELQGFPAVLSELHLSGEMIPGRPHSSPIIADIDADGLNDVVVLDSDGLLFAIGEDGLMSEGFPKVSSGPTAIAPFLVDDAGERTLLLFESLGDSLSRGPVTRDARLNAIALPAVAPGPRPAEWTGLWGGAERSARGMEGVVASATPLLSLQRESDPLIQPNPVRGRSAQVRFWSGANHEAKITLYNLEGEEMLEASTTVAADLAATVSFDTNLLAPGGYLCRLEYVGTGGPSTSFLNLYIER